MSAQKMLEEKIEEFAGELNPGDPEKFAPICAVLERLSMTYAIVVRGATQSSSGDDDA